VGERVYIRCIVVLDIWRGGGKDAVGLVVEGARGRDGVGAVCG